MTNLMHYGREFIGATTNVRPWHAWQKPNVTTLRGGVTREKASVCCQIRNRKSKIGVNAVGLGDFRERQLAK